MITVLATIALLSSNVVRFEAPPETVIQRIATRCMENGHAVLEMSQSQIRCEVPMTDVERGHFLFTMFHQRNYTSQVRMIAGYTVLPSGEQSMVQGRMWLEAQINGSAQTRDLPNGPEATAGLLRTFEGAVQEPG